MRHDAYVAAQYAEIEAIKVEVAGMEAENALTLKEPPGNYYTEEDFNKKANRLLKIQQNLMEYWREQS